MTPRDDLRALAEAHRENIAEIRQQSGKHYTGCNCTFCNVIARSERALAAAQQTPQEQCHWCKHAQARHVHGEGTCIVYGCPCVRFVVVEVAPQTPAARPAEDEPPEGFVWLSKSLGAVFPTHEHARATWPVHDTLPESGILGDYARLRDGSVWLLYQQGEWRQVAPVGTLMPPTDEPPVVK